jgi:hypothetical protein
MHRQQRRRKRQIEGDHPMEHGKERLSPVEEWKYAERSLAWHGWGSPVGLGFVLISLGVTAVLARFALLGF